MNSITNKVILGFLLLFALLCSSGQVNAQPLAPNEPIVASMPSPSYTVDEQRVILQNEFAIAQRYLGSINLPTQSETIHVAIKTKAEFEAINVSTYWAAALPSGIWIRDDIAAIMVTSIYRENTYPNKASGMPPIYRRLILHELLHYIQAVPVFQSNSKLFIEGRNLEEGIVDSISFDLLQSYTRFRYGKSADKRFAFNMQFATEQSGYKDQIVEVRKISAKLAGLMPNKWRDKRAFNMRIKLLLVAFDVRQGYIQGLQ